jgi:hypothetical protein
MTSTQYPAPSTGSSTSTILPVNASSVLLDGELTSAGTYTTTINGNGGIAYLTATDNNAIFTIGGIPYSVLAGSTVATIATVGSSTSATVSAYGATWTGTPSSFTATSMPSDYYTGVAYGNGIFVAGQSGNTAKIYYSANGSTWTTGLLPSNGFFGLIFFGNGYFVLPSTPVSYYSTNGKTWSAGGDVVSIANGFYGNGVFIAGGGNGTSAYVSINNGISWSTVTLPTNHYWNVGSYGVVGGVGYYQLFNGSASNSDFCYSTNAFTWTAGSLPASRSIYASAYGNGKFIALGPAATATWFYSTDGINYNNMTMPTSTNWYAAGYGNGYFVAAKYGSTAAAYSTNGTTWTAATMPNAGYWYSIAYGNGTFVATQLNTTTANAYFNFTTATYTLPVNFGIYAGPTTIN